jgi:hypothetical protein
MIGDCENCDRRSVPVRYLDRTTQCYVCLGDVADPYGELEQTTGETLTERLRQMLRRDHSTHFTVNRPALELLVADSERYAALNGRFSKCVAAAQALQRDGLQITGETPIIEQTASRVWALVHGVLGEQTKIDAAQMAADFATIPFRGGGPMRRARAIVELHIADYGMVPHPDKIKEAIAAELGLAEIKAADRSASAIALLRDGLSGMAPDERMRWKVRVEDFLARDQQIEAMKLK